MSVIDEETRTARWYAQDLAEQELRAIKARERWPSNCVVFDAGPLGLLVYTFQVASGRHEPHWVDRQAVLQVKALEPEA